MGNSSYSLVLAVKKTQESKIDLIKQKYRMEAIQQDKCVSLRESKRINDRIYLLVDPKSTLTVEEVWGADNNYLKLDNSEVVQGPPTNQHDEAVVATKPSSLDESDEIEVISDEEIEEVPSAQLATPA